MVLSAFYIHVKYGDKKMTRQEDVKRVRYDVLFVPGVSMFAISISIRLYGETSDTYVTMVYIGINTCTFASTRLVSINITEG